MNLRTEAMDDTNKVLLTESFWSIADEEKLIAEYKVDKDLKFLQSASLSVLKRIFIQYRFFTIFYISDLAFLLAKLPFGGLRSLLAEILNEELGNGKKEHSHPYLYDQFLQSLEIDKENYQKPHEESLNNLKKIQDSLQKQSWAYGIGLRGMGGECLCQIYLSAMYENFILNPVIQEHKNCLKMLFWNIHIGEVDIHHREQIKKAINELISENPETIMDITNGYLESKRAWDYFWKSIYRNAIAS